jgi:hypothetical protein
MPESDPNQMAEQGVARIDNIGNIRDPKNAFLAMRSSFSVDIPTQGLDSNVQFAPTLSTANLK